MKKFEFQERAINELLRYTINNIDEQHIDITFSAPVGSGKTLLIERLTRVMSKDYSCAVITNDIYTKEDAKFIFITNNNKSREIYLDYVVSKVDDTQLFKKLKGNGNRSRQGFMIWNMRSYKNNEEITNFEII